MNTELPQHISDYYDVAMTRLARVGGPQAALRAETDDLPREQAAAALSDIGAHDLDVRADADAVLAAAALCRAAGYVALPYPVVDELLALDGARLALVDPVVPRIEHADLGGAWLAIDLERRRYDVAPSHRSTAKLGPFLVPAELHELDGLADDTDVDLHLVLGSWRIWGALDRCLQIACDHVSARTQFGRPLAEFQAVRFAVANASVAVTGLGELAKYTVSRLTSAPSSVRGSDALMLRLHAVDTAVDVLRTAHQLLGALGFCDESDLSVIDRHLQPALRYPVDAEQVAWALSEEIGAGRVETLFSGAP